MIRNKGKHVFSLIMASALMMGVVNIPAHATDITSATSTTTTGAAVTIGETNSAENTIIKPGETVEIKNTSGVKYRLSLKDNTSDIKVDYITYLADGKGYELANDVTDKARLAYVFNNSITKVTNEGTSDLQIHCIDTTNAFNPVVADDKVTITRVAGKAIATATVQPNETYSIVNFTGNTTTVYYDSPSTEVVYLSYKDDATKGTGTTMQHSYSITKSISNNTRADVTNTNSTPMTIFFDGGFVNTIEDKTIIKPGETVEIKNTSGVKYRLSLKDNTSDIKVDYATYLADGKGYELANDVTDKAKLAYVFNNAITKVTNEGSSNLQIHCIDTTNAFNPVVADDKVTINRVEKEALSIVTIQPNETYSIVNFTGKSTTVYYDSPSTEVVYLSYKDDATKGTGTTMPHYYSITKSIGNNTRADVTNTNSTPMKIFLEGNFENSPK